MIMNKLEKQHHVDFSGVVAIDVSGGGGGRHRPFVEDGVRNGTEAYF